MGDHNNSSQDLSENDKVAILACILERRCPEDLLLALRSHDGCIDSTIDALLEPSSNAELFPRKRPNTGRIQSALSFKPSSTLKRKNRDCDISPNVRSKGVARKGKTVYLYDPASIAKHTPCSIIHNFLSRDLADDLLKELLPETETYTSIPLRMFENVVKSPHTASFYVDRLEDYETATGYKGHITEGPLKTSNSSTYLYNGSPMPDVRNILPVMKKVSLLVQNAVNQEIQDRIQTYPNQQKLKYQHPGPWLPNAACVNCYDGAQQSVGYHTDQLTYLGPKPVIGSLTLGVQREFRIRRITDKKTDEELKAMTKSERQDYEDLSGQISLPLPHNSLLVMHSNMQELYKHSVHPAAVITPHPLAGNKRINITYRFYRDDFKPELIPKCKCGEGCVLKFVKGRYIWMCQVKGRVSIDVKLGKADNISGAPGCRHFVEAFFDDHGHPLLSRSVQDRYDNNRDSVSGTGKLPE